MIKYYTRACNFKYGSIAKELIKKKRALPLCGDKSISFNEIEIITRNKDKIYSKIINYKNISSLSSLQRNKVIKDLKNITSKRKNFLKHINFIEPSIMGIINLTPDSFSDGGKFNKNNKSLKHITKMILSGANLIDVGGESTRPGSKTINPIVEWKRIKFVIKKFKKKYKKTCLSIDTRKSDLMVKSIKYGVDLINDVSGFNYDQGSLSKLEKYNIAKVLHHMQGTPNTMQKKPKYKNVLLDIYDFFENKIKFLRSVGIKHNNIIIDPGIGFGKNLKHNMSLISKISIFHSLGFPILVGNSKKKFIKELSGKNDTKRRFGGTIASSLYLMMQGVQILRIHDVDETLQGVKVFKELIK